MLDNNTIAKLREMKLSTMATALGHQLGDSKFHGAFLRGTHRFDDRRGMDCPPKQQTGTAHAKRRVLPAGGFP